LIAIGVSNPKQDNSRGFKPQAVAGVSKTPGSSRGSKTLRKKRGFQKPQAVVGVLETPGSSRGSRNPRQ